MAAEKKEPDAADALVAKHAPDAQEAPKKSQATVLTDLALERFDLYVTPEGEPFAVPKTGPRLVRMLRGGRGSLRAELARLYFERCSSAPSQAALADALQVITGIADQEDPTPLHLRVAQHGGALVLDLGDMAGRAVVIRPEGWEVEPSPVLFRRSELTGVLPEPHRGAELSELWGLLNVADRYRPVLTAVLVSALMPTMPHVITALTGEQGTGKTSAMRMLAGLIDPSPAQVRKAPRDVETWTTAAAGSWVVALDNLSGISDQISDALCRASTGDGDVRRRLYSDGDLHVISFLRVVFVNGIDLGALNDDLVDRLVTIGLERIPDRKRRKDADMTRAWQAAHPRVLGALLDLACAVLRVLPSTQLPAPPRMADYGYVLAAVDRVLDTGGKGLETYVGSRTEMAEEVVTSDPVLAAITESVTEAFLGTSADLLRLITPGRPDWKAPRDWPTARELTGIVRRRAPSMRRVGWTVDELPRGGRNKQVRLRLDPPEQREGDTGARNARNARAEGVPAGPSAAADAGDTRATAGDTGDGARNARNGDHNARNMPHTLTSENGALTGDTGVAGTADPLSRIATCTSCCGNPLLLRTAGRDTCEGCRRRNAERRAAS